MWVQSHCSTCPPVLAAAVERDTFCLSPVADPSSAGENSECWTERTEGWREREERERGRAGRERMERGE